MNLDQMLQDQTQTIDSQQRICLGKERCSRYGLEGKVFLSFPMGPKRYTYLIVSSEELPQNFTLGEFELDEEYRLVLPPQALKYLGDVSELFIGKYNGYFSILKKDW